MIPPIQRPRSSATPSWPVVKEAGAAYRAMGTAASRPSKAAAVVFRRPLAMAPMTARAGSDHSRYIMD